MALNLSKRTRYIMGLILFIPLILSFMIWGIDDMIKATGTARYAAMVGNITISTQEFQRAYQQQIEGMRRQGIQIDSAMAQNLGLGKGVLRNLIERELLLQGANDYGIRVDDKMVANEIRKERAFYDESGKFSGDKFKQLLKNAGVGEQEFIAGLKGDIAIRFFLTAIQNAALPPSALPVAMVMLQNTQYTADVYTLSYGVMQNVGNPTETELQTFYNAEKDNYQRPEMRKLTMAVLSTKDFMANLKPSDDDLRTIYDAHKTEFSEPEERSLQFVVLPDEKSAQAVAERARGGEKLSAAASAVAASKIELKKMENVKRGSLPAELDKAAFKLPRAETSEPVNTPLGWYVMQITNIKTGITPPFEQMKNKLIAQWQNDQAGQTLPKTLNQLDDDIAGGETLDELAKKYKLQLRDLPIMDAQGNGQDTKVSADSSLAGALAAGFKQNQGEIGNLFETPDGNYALVRVDEIQPSAVPQLARIKQQVITDWRQKNARQIAEESARELANAWRDKDDVTAAANKINANVNTISLTRQNTEKQLATPALANAILRSGDVGEVVTATDNKAEYIAKIRAIKVPVTDNLPATTLAQMTDLATEWVKNDYLQIFLNALEKAHPIEINEKAVKQIESAG
jgi:peptidyl-prolyl cis-trans isomerase D